MEEREEEDKVERKRKRDCWRIGNKGKKRNHNGWVKGLLKVGGTRLQLVSTKQFRSIDSMA